MENLNSIQQNEESNQSTQQSPEIITLQCNKCGLVVEMLPTQESIYQSDYMHQFNPKFNFCGKDTNIDMQTCEFFLCQSCLLQLFDTFTIKPQLKDDKEWWRT